MHPLAQSLVVRASGGLSNRLQAVAAGVAYCLLTGRHLCVDWRDGLYSDDFSNVFPLWFTLEGLPSLSCQNVCDTYDHGASLYPLFWKDWLKDAVAVEYLFPGNDHVLPHNVALSSADLTRLDAPEDIVVFWGWDMAPVHSLIPLLRQKFSHLARSSDDDIVRWLLATHIRPAADLKAQVDAFMARHFAEGQTVGIHIRHTDMHSPLDRMLAALQRIAGEDKAIFLCTDNARVEKMVRRLFPRTVVRPKTFQGNGIPLHCHVPGISNVHKGHEALMDMLILSRCQHIIHHTRSSFARIPALLSGLAPEYIYSIS